MTEPPPLPSPPPSTTRGQRGFLWFVTVTAGVVGVLVTTGAAWTLVRGTEETTGMLVMLVVGLIILAAAIHQALGLGQFYRSRRAMERTGRELDSAIADRQDHPHRNS